MGEPDRGRAGGPRLHAWARRFAATTAAGLFLGLLGPFGSYLNASRWWVLGYWVASLWIGALLFGVTLPLTVAAARRLGLPAPGAVGFATLVTALPLAIICRLGAQALWPAAIRGIGGLAWYGQTLIVSAPFALGFGWLTGLRLQVEAPPPPVAWNPRTFMSRLHPRLGRALVALQMEDHYVRAHTRLGSTLILVPLRQAIEELEELRGLKVHRSWWVADEAVLGAVRDGRNLRLKLAGDLEAPVARSAVADVRARGWLRALD